MRYQVFNSEEQYLDWLKTEAAPAPELLESMKGAVNEIEKTMQLIAIAKLNGQVEDQIKYSLYLRDIVRAWRYRE